VARWFQKFHDFRRDVMSESRLHETIGQLVTDGELTPENGERLATSLRETSHETGYIAGHLCAHLAIGLVFSFDIIPLPLGSISRGLWVAGNRVYVMLRRQPERSKVHSVPVLLVSLIPFAGYFAYLIPLRAANADAAYLYANHVAYVRSGCSLEQALHKLPAWRQRLVGRLLGFAISSPQADQPQSRGDADPS